MALNLANPLRRNRMSYDLIGRILFPRQQAWQARRHARQLVAALLVAVIFGLVVGALIWLANTKR